ncbi:MAG: leucine-rich repeat protein [Coprococcus sp.]
MRKEILFKKGIITALTVAMVTSLAPVIGAGGLKTITAKAEGTESHNYNSQGFCTECDAYQSAVLTTDKYDIDDDNSKDDVYEIGNAGQLFWFAGLVNGTLDGVKQNKLANAVLTANITVNENLLDSLQYDTEGNVSNGSDFITWTPIADWMGNRTTQYSGTFDGNNKTVSGLYFNGDSTCIGLFGSSESDGNIKNVGVVDSYFKGNDHVGGVCGNNAGTITNCYNAGNLTAIESSADIGGICGYNNGGTIANCYNTGTVTATGSAASVGGVCGCSIELILNCYNIGTVTAASSDADISGICGYNFGPVKNCYYLADTEDENGGKTAAQFASGEIAYLLSQGCSTGEGDATVTYDGSIWGQPIGTDTYPLLHGEKVYKNITYLGCNDLSDVVSVVYSNEDKTTYGDHDYVDGVCRYCDEEALASVTSGEIITYYPSLQDAIDCAENIPSSVVAVIADTEHKTCYVNNPDSDFTIDINGNNLNGVTVNNGKITIIDSKANGEIQGNLTVNSDSIVTLGDVKVSGNTDVYGQLILNGGDLGKIYFYEDKAKVFFNNSDIKIRKYIYWFNEYFEALTINAEPHNIIPILLNGTRLEVNTSLARGGDNITLDVNWFNESLGLPEIDSTFRIEDNKLIVSALINDKIKTEFEEGETFTYSGAELKPTVRVYINRVVFDDEQLIENTDYTVTYSDNINAGTATVTITGIGAYSGSKNVTFTIEPKKIDSPTFDGLKSEYTYTGQAIEPEFTLWDGDTVIPSSEYEVIYSDNTEVGTATVTIKDASGGNYEVNCKAEFNIVKIDTVIINELPVADAVSYDPNKTLGAINISGGNVLDPSGKNVPGSWSWADTSVVPTVDNSGYDVVFTPDEQEHYNPVSGTVQVNVSKADVNVVDLPVASAITYGDDLAKAVISVGRVSFDGIDQVEIPGTFAWKDESIKPFVSDSDKTLYTVVFTPADSVNYNTAEAEITVNVSKAAMPNLVMSVDNTHKTVGSISLPGDWTWLDKDTETVIKAGGSVEAIAIYVGDDKENYDSTELKITIYRAACSEGKTVKYTLKGEKAPTCTKAGTGHTECSICGDVMSTGVYVKELGHKWNSGRVTKKPTYTATGVKTFTCTVCKATKTGSIAKLATTDISKNTSKITVSGIENKIYNGKVHTQKSLVVKAGAKTLRLNKDYTVTYSKNKAVGKASVIIRGKNAYSGKITKTFAIVKAAKGKTYTVGKFKYTITGAKADGTGTVAIAGTTYSRSDKKFVSLTIADTVVIGDVRFKITSVSANAFSRYTMLTSVVIGKNVTSIGSNAFVSCKNLKKMTIKSAKLKSVGAKAFSGTYSKITFAVPRNKAKAYKKLIKKGSPSAKAIYK